MIDDLHALSQKNHMHACFLHHSAFNVAYVRRTLGLMLFAFGMTLAVTLSAAAIARAPLSAPLSDLDLERQLLAGSDALLERMVIPPNRPDWVLMDCSEGHDAKAETAVAGEPTSEQASVYDQIRRTLCEARHASHVAAF